MSFTYHFSKAGFPLDRFREAIGKVVDPGDDNGVVPEGTWRELLLSSMMRERSDDEGEYYEHFLTAGGIRGVPVFEDGEEIHIRISSFASRTDQYLAARFAWEAMQLGAEVWKEGYEGAGALTVDQLGADAIEEAHAEWWKLSRGTLSAIGSEGRLPILGDLFSLTIRGSDASMPEEGLEAHYASQVEKLGDAFPSSTMDVNMPGVGKKSIHILQWELSSLLSKSIDGVKLPGEERGVVPIEALVELASHHLTDGCESWVCARGDRFEDGLLDQLNQRSFGGAPSGELTDADWAVIAQAPIIAFVLVAAADGNVDKKELKRFAEILGGLAEQQGHLPTARMMQLAMAAFGELIPRLISGEVDALDALEAFVSVVDSKMSDVDAGKVKMSVLVLAKEVAEASGGFFGFGSKIDKDEKKALGALIHILGFGG